MTAVSRRALIGGLSTLALAAADPALAAAWNLRNKHPLAKSYAFTGQSALGIGTGMPADFLTAWSGPTAGTIGLEPVSSFLRPASVYSGTAKLVRQDNRGLRLEPASTNEAVNPRMLGAVAATLSTPDAARTLPAGAISATAGSYIYTITDPGHGLSNGDRVAFLTSARDAALPAGYQGIGVPVGSYAVADYKAWLLMAANATGSDASKNYTVQNVTANTFDIFHHNQVGDAPAATTATNADACTYRRCSFATPGTLPTGSSIRDVSGGTRGIRLTALTEASSTTPINSRRSLNIYGTGTAYLNLASIACGQGQKLSFSQVAHMLNRRGSALDDNSFANTVIGVAFVERDGSGTILGETVVDQTPNIVVYSGFFYRMVASAVAQNGACASVDIALRFSGALGCDHQLEVFDFMVSKSQHRPSIVLPAWNTTGSTSKVAETCAGVVPGFTIRGADYMFESREIVSNVDTIVSFGTVELQAVGLAFPRDLRLTDGTNAVTLSGALRDLWTTQQLVRASMSFGPAGLALSMTDDFMAGARSGSTPAYAGAVPTSVNLNEDAGGGKRGMTSAKLLTLYGAERSAADVVTASRLTWNCGFAVPGVDTPVGRISTNPLKPFSAAQLIADNITYFNITDATKKTVSLKSTAAGQTIEDYDFSGWIIQQGAAVTNFKFRNCVFDMSNPNITSYPIYVYVSGCSGWTIENCDSYARGGNAAAHFGIIGTGATVQRNVFHGQTSDIVDFLEGCTFQDNILLYDTSTRLGSHSDAIQTNNTLQTEMLLQRNLIDARKLIGGRMNSNYAIGNIPGVGGSDILKKTTIRDMVVLGGAKGLVVAPKKVYGASTTWAGELMSDAEHVFSNLRTALIEVAGCDATVNLAFNQMVFSTGGQNITISNAGGRAYCQNFLGMKAGTYADGWRGGGIRNYNDVTPMSLTTILSGTTPTSLQQPLAVGDAIGFSMGGNSGSITVVASGASGDSQINVTDTVGLFVTKMMNQLPGLIVTLSPYRVTVLQPSVEMFTGLPIFDLGAPSASL